eukprot:359440-Chlamydomonas_euryale.AAC.2
MACVSSWGKPTTRVASANLLLAAMLGKLSSCHSAVLYGQEPLARSTMHCQTNSRSTNHTLACRLGTSLSGTEWNGAVRSAVQCSGACNRRIRSARRGAGTLRPRSNVLFVCWVGMADPTQLASVRKCHVGIYTKRYRGGDPSQLFHGSRIASARALKISEGCQDIQDFVLAAMTCPVHTEHLNSVHP